MESQWPPALQDHSPLTTRSWSRSSSRVIFARFGGCSDLLGRRLLIYYHLSLENPRGRNAKTAALWSKHSTSLFASRNHAENNPVTAELLSTSNEKLLRSQLVLARAEKGQLRYLLELLVGHLSFLENLNRHGRRSRCRI